MPVSNPNVEKISWQVILLSFFDFFSRSWGELRTKDLICKSYAGISGNSSSAETWRRAGTIHCNESACWTLSCHWLGKQIHAMARVLHDLFRARLFHPESLRSYASPV